MSVVQPMVISGREVWPLVEGGKGVSVSNGRSAGAWAAAGGVGTFSGVNRRRCRRARRATSRWSSAAATGSSATRS